MIILLLTLFAVALIITLAGFALSPRPQVPPQRSYATRGGTRIYRSTGTTQQIQSIRKTSTTQQMQSIRKTSTRYTPTLQQRAPWQLADFSSWVPFFNLRQFIEPRSGQPTPWPGLFLVLIALFGIGFVSLRPVFSSPTAIAAFWDSIPVVPAIPTPVPAKNVEPVQPVFKGVAGASKALTRISQMDVAQYASRGEYDTWAVSACSAVSMTAVMNAYGHNYRVTDILREEIAQHQITPELGLLYPSGINKTVNKFGFQAVQLANPSLNTVLEIANNGRPVIISFPPQTWTGGHILVLRGGNGNEVYLADSSNYNMTVMSVTNFKKYWRGFAVVVTPK